MATLRYTSGVVSKKSSSANLYFHFSLADVGTWLRNNGVGAHAKINSMYLTAYVANDVGSNKATLQVSISPNGSDTGAVSGYSNFINASNAVGGNSSNINKYDSKTSTTNLAPLFNNQNANTPYVLNSYSSATVCVHTYLFVLKQFNWNVYYTLDVDFTPHTCSYTTEIARTPSTCYTKGSVTKQCSCGATQTTDLALDPNNHAGGTEVRNAVAATCAAEGYTGDTYCKGCGAILSSGTAIAKLAHTWVDATCTTPKTCSVCGATEGQPLGHNYVENVVPPSSTDNGYTNYTCSRCGHSYRDKYTCQIYGTVSPLNTGTVKINDGSNWEKVNYGDTITLTANAIKGYNFVQWNDGNTDNPRTVTATNSITYTAFFEEVAAPPVFSGYYRCSDIYIDEENKKIIFKSNNTIPQNSDTIDTVDGWNFETIFNGQPAGVKRVEKIYIGNTLIYSAKG